MRPQIIASESSSVPRRPQGLPGYMAGSLYRARKGGCDGYERAGFQLGQHLKLEQPHDVDRSEWYDVIAEVDDAATDGEVHEPGLLAWLDYRFPKIMALVPQRQRSNFVQGFCRARREEGR